jgi:hypothetical protein
MLIPGLILRDAAKTPLQDEGRQLMPRLSSSIVACSAFG